MLRRPVCRAWPLLSRATAIFGTTAAEAVAYNVFRGDEGDGDDDDGGDACSGGCHRWLSRRRRPSPTTSVAVDVAEAAEATVRDVTGSAARLPSTVLPPPPPPSLSRSAARPRQRSTTGLVCV